MYFPVLLETEELNSEQVTKCHSTNYGDLSLGYWTPQSLFLNGEKCFIIENDTSGSLKS